MGATRLPVLRLDRPCGLQFPITSWFGKRVDPLHPTIVEKQQHNGIDFGCPVGTPILAPCDGFLDFKFDVEWMPGTRTRSLGFFAHITVQLNGSGIYIVHLAHLSEALAKPGHIERGAPLGLSGGDGDRNDTEQRKHIGSSTGPHLHEGVRQLDPGWLNPRWVDPAQFFTFAI